MVKPNKPYPDFPLTPCANGQFCKKINGVIFYFGIDPEKALKEYEENYESLRIGIDPRTYPFEAVSVKELFDRYLHREKRRAESGDIRFNTWLERKAHCKKAADFLGRRTPVVLLCPDVFARLYFAVSKTLGPYGQKSFVVQIKSVFKWGYETHLLKEPMHFGPDFKPPPKRVFRLARSQSPKKFFQAEEIRRLVDAADAPMKAMILLGINGGFGNTDVALLTLQHFNEEPGWLDFPRPKTGMPRRVPLWPETVVAIEKSLAVRRQSVSNRLFLNRFGRPWSSQNELGTVNNTVTSAFTQLVKRLNLARARVGFYALRHTFRTIADATCDKPAINLIMGHVGRERMANYYCEEIEDSRLRFVVDHVRSWLYR